MHIYIYIYKPSRLRSLSGLSASSLQGGRREVLFVAAVWDQTLVADGLEPPLRGWQRWKDAPGGLRSLGGTQWGLARGLALRVLGAVAVSRQGTPRGTGYRESLKASGRMHGEGESGKANPKRSRASKTWAFCLRLILSWF